MTQEELYRLTEKFLHGTLTAAEKELLEQWYRQGTDKEIDIIVQADADYKDYKNEAAFKDGLLQQIKAAIATEEANTIPVAHRVHFLKTSWFRVAAAIILITGVGYFFWLFNKNGGLPLADNRQQVQTDIAPGGNKATLMLADGSVITLDEAKDGDLAQQGNAKVVKLGNGQLAYRAGDMPDKAMVYNTMTTPRGGQYQLTLPDGSKVWLNAASSIRFPASFDGASRAVEITGEAYLEVAKNARQPFLLKANGMEVKVLGTSFNVNAYTNEDAIKTTLVEGSVKVIKGNNETMLKPGQQCSVINDRALVAKVNIDQALAWKNGFFHFNNADLVTVLRQLERWYNIDVIYSGKIPTRYFSGELPRSLMLSQIISVLNEMEVKFRIEGKTLIVRS